MSFERDWEVAPCPCPAPEPCGAYPVCEVCVGAEKMFREQAEAEVPWADLDEWKRESWRREFLDPDGSKGL